MPHGVFGNFVVKSTGRGLVVKQRGGFLVRTNLELSKTGYLLSEAERVGVGAFSPLPIP